MIWGFVVVLIVALTVAYAMQPKLQEAKPAGLSDFQVPTAQVGREIPVLFGTRDLAGPNVVWYGDLSVKKVYD
jgi:hypothetical protein